MPPTAPALSEGDVVEILLLLRQGRTVAQILAAVPGSNPELVKAVALRGAVAAEGDIQRAVDAVENYPRGAPNWSDNEEQRRWQTLVGCCSVRDVYIASCAYRADEQRVEPARDVLFRARCLAFPIGGLPALIEYCDRGDKLDGRRTGGLSNVAVSAALAALAAALTASGVVASVAASAALDGSGPREYARVKEALDGHIMMSDCVPGSLLISAEISACRDRLVAISAKAVADRDAWTSAVTSRVARGDLGALAELLAAVQSQAHRLPGVERAVRLAISRAVADARAADARAAAEHRTAAP